MAGRTDGPTGTPASTGGRWSLLDGLAKVTSIERVRKCRRATRGENVAIARRGDRAHFCGLVTCGSIWSCPLCSARIWAVRRGEIERAIHAHHQAGGRVVMKTLTMRHQARDSLSDLWDAVSEAWGAASGGNNSAAR